MTNSINTNTDYSGAAVVDYPAVVAVQPADNSIEHGDVVWVQPKDKSKLGWWFTASDVASVAAKDGRDAEQAVERARQHEHSVYWLLEKPVSVSNTPSEKEVALYFEEGDTVYYSDAKTPLKIVAQANGNWGFEEL